MAKFESKTFEVSTDVQSLKAFLTVPGNLIQILPEDRIEMWESSETGCSFKIKGLAHITIVLNDAENDDAVRYESVGEKPFKFSLNVLLSPSEKGSSVRANFDADVNSFMAAMLSKPLTNFLNHLGGAIQSKFES